MVLKSKMIAYVIPSQNVQNLGPKYSLINFNNTTQNNIKLKNGPVAQLGRALVKL